MAPTKADAAVTGRGGLWATIFTLLSLSGAVALVFVAIASDGWFEYDAEFSDNIDVPLLEAEGEGFQLTRVASVFRYIVYASLIAFIGSAIMLVIGMKLISWERRTLVTLIVLFTTMLLIIAFASLFVVRGGLSRREEYDVTTTPHSTTSPPTTASGATTGSTTTTHKPVVVTYFGDASRFMFKMPFWCILIATLLMLLVVILFDGYIAWVEQSGPTPWMVKACGMSLNTLNSGQRNSYELKSCK